MFSLKRDLPFVSSERTRGILQGTNLVPALRRGHLPRVPERFPNFSFCRSSAKEVERKKFLFLRTFSAGWGLPLDFCKKRESGRIRRYLSKGSQFGRLSQGCFIYSRVNLVFTLESIRGSRAFDRAVSSTTVSQSERDIE